jgi:hypothetical protein
MNGLPPIVEPDLSALLALQKQDIFASFNCHQLGAVVSFNTANQTASVSLNIQRLVYNQQIAVDQLSNQKTPTAPNVIDYPVLVQVPVMIYSGGGGYVSCPIAAGDTCLVLFNDRNIDSWFATGAVTVPASQRMHDLSDGLAIVGFRSLANVIAGYDGANVHIHSPTLLNLTNEVTSLKAVLQLATAALTDLNSVKTGGDASSSIAAYNAAVTSLLA